MRQCCRWCGRNAAIRVHRIHILKHSGKRFGRFVWWPCLECTIEIKFGLIELTSGLVTFLFVAGLGQLCLSSYKWKWANSWGELRKFLPCLLCIRMFLLFFCHTTLCVVYRTVKKFVNPSFCHSVLLKHSTACPNSLHLTWWIMAQDIAAVTQFCMLCGCHQTGSHCIILWGALVQVFLHSCLYLHVCGFLIQLRRERS